MATAVRSQQTPPVGPVWEYASVSSVATKVSVCYASPSGCRNESSGSLMESAARLGEKGWELAATSDEVTGRTLYFKRLRSAIHRND